MSDTQGTEAPVQEQTEMSLPAGQASDDWRMQIDEEYRGDKALASFKDINGLAKSHIHATRMIGADKVVLPSKGSSDEEINQFYTKLGRPENVEGYKLQSKAENPDTTLLNNFQNIAFNANLTNDQAQTVLDQYDAMVAETNKQLAYQEETEIQEQTAALQKKFGPAWQEKLNLASSMIENFGDKNSKLFDRKTDNGTSVGNDPRMIELLVNIGDYIAKNIGEDKLVGVKQSNAQTRQDLLDERDKLQRQDGPYWDNRHPDHDRIVNKVLAINEKIEEYT